MSYWNELTSNISCKRAMEIDENMTQDIDSETDWKLAELKYKLNR